MTKHRLQLGTLIEFSMCSGLVTAQAMADAVAYGQYQQVYQEYHLKCGALAALDKVLDVVNQQVLCPLEDLTLRQLLIQ